MVGMVKDSDTVLGTNPRQTGMLVQCSATRETNKTAQGIEHYVRCDAIRRWAAGSKAKLGKVKQRKRIRVVVD